MSVSIIWTSVLVFIRISLITGFIFQLKNNILRTNILTYLLTAWSRVLLEKLTGFAANQEIPRILWNPKIHYRTHKRPPPILILNDFTVSKYGLCKSYG